MTTREQAFRDWVERARAADISAVVARFGPSLRRAGRELVGPCPRCGGRDRFSINPDLGVFFCRRPEEVGGDVIALVQHITMRDFVGACEEIVGEPPPGRDVTETAAERAAREARIAAEIAAAEEARAAREADSAAYREAERRRAYAIWCAGRRLDGTVTAAYLERRGLTRLGLVRLRHAPELGYFERLGGAAASTRIATTPAMLAAITDAEGRFSGVHITHLAVDGSGKAEILHPETGERCDPKKVRGSQRGRWIRLVGPETARRLVIGEGIETVLSVREALIAAGRDTTDRLFAAAINLGNLGGPAAGTMRHPDELFDLDRAGRKRVRRIASAEPSSDPAKPAIVVPEAIEAITILGDGDSDPAETRNACARAAARWARPGRSIAIAFAPAGEDFNDTWRAEIARGRA